ncbi:MAG: hypothetical protein RLZZ479_1029 [Bacteroidota bacterium]
MVPWFHEEKLNIYAVFNFTTIKGSKTRYIHHWYNLYAYWIGNYFSLSNEFKFKT